MSHLVYLGLDANSLVRALLLEWEHLQNVTILLMTKEYVPRMEAITGELKALQEQCQHRYARPEDIDAQCGLCGHPLQLPPIRMPEWSPDCGPHCSH